MKTNFLIALLISPVLCWAQWTQVGNTMLAENTDDRAGADVSINDDGKVIAVGAPLNSDNGQFAGQTLVYREVNGTWYQMGGDLEGDGTENYFGNCVDLNANGRIVAMGAWGNDANGLNAGQAKVFRLTGGAWVPFGAPILGQTDEFFGSSISISANGRTLAISGAGAKDPMLNLNRDGIARVYRYKGGMWKQLGSDIIPENAYDVSASVWPEVCLSDDGKVLAVGAPEHEFTKGLVRTYRFQGGNWVQFGQDIIGQLGSFNGDVLGVSLSLSEDGSRMAMAALDPTNDSRGWVRVYELQLGSWVQLGQQILGGPIPGDGSDLNVSLNNAGTILAVGVPSRTTDGSDGGEVRTYEYNGAQWVISKDSITGTGAAGFGLSGDNFGSSVSLNADGDRLAVGAPLADDGEAKVYKCALPFFIDPNILKKFGFVVYPNPFFGETLYIVLRDEYKNIQVVVYDMMGEPVTKAAFKREKELKLPLEKIDRGRYIVKITAGKEAFSQQIVVE